TAIGTATRHWLWSGSRTWLSCARKMAIQRCGVSLSSHSQPLSTGTLFHSITTESCSPKRQRTCLPSTIRISYGLWKPKPRTQDRSQLSRPREASMLVGNLLAEQVAADVTMNVKPPSSKRKRGHECPHSLQVFGKPR